MHVIGGSAKRRQLRAPDIDSLRPTSDRVREAIFDILASRDALDGSAVLDAFAGSGALGIEALCAVPPRPVLSRATAEQSLP